MFKKDDYVVILRPEMHDTSWIKYQYCYHQLIDSTIFHTSYDNQGTMTKIDKIHYSSDWYRMATHHEIKEYKRRNNPYDVTTIKPFIAESDKIFKVDINGITKIN